MIKIRLVTFYEAPNCWNAFDDEDDRDIEFQLNDYVFCNIDTINSSGFEVEDFELPDSFMMGSNRQFVDDICQGKSFAIWSNAGVDFHDEYYQNWIFYKNKDTNKWEEF